MCVYFNTNTHSFICILHLLPHLPCLLWQIRDANIWGIFLQLLTVRIEPQKVSRLWPLRSIGIFFWFLLLFLFWTRQFFSLSNRKEIFTFGEHYYTLISIMPYTLLLSFKVIIQQWISSNTYHSLCRSWFLLFRLFLAFLLFFFIPWPPTAVTRLWVGRGGWWVTVIPVNIIEWLSYLKT